MDVDTRSVPTAAVSLPLHDPTQWPLRMTRDEVLHVCRRKRAWLSNRIKEGRFPRPDSDFMWARETVRRYVLGDIQKFDREAARQKRHPGQRSQRGRAK